VTGAAGLTMPPAWLHGFTVGIAIAVIFAIVLVGALITFYFWIYSPEHKRLVRRQRERRRQASR
jgi:hypothetical protein